jgi:hypothetical protein
MKMKTILSLIVFTLIGCHHGAEVLPVAVVAWPTNPKPSCQLPGLPAEVTIAGWPDMERQQIVVTRHDLEALITYEIQIHAWLAMAEQCFAKLAPAIQEKP